MITTIKTSEENLKNIQPIIDKYNAIVYIDKNINVPLHGFNEMLNIEFDDYRFHIQDDVVLADDLDKYLQQLNMFLIKNRIDFLSLSAAPNKRLTAEYFVGKRIAEYRNDRYILHDNKGIIYSKKLINYMKNDINTPNKIFEDELSFINFVLGKHGIIGYVHLPILVNINNDLTKQSNSLFEKNFIKEYYNRK